MPKSTNQHEVNRATLSIAGWRVVLQDVHTATTGTSTAYTVAGRNTRRVVVCFTGSFLDIRVEVNAAAEATDFPLMPDFHHTFDLSEDETLNFYNTTGGDISVYILEIF